MPLGRGIQTGEAPCCPKSSDDTQHAASPAAWGMPSRTVPPHPACRTHIRMLQGEDRLTAHRHRLTLCGKQSSEHAASPAAWGVPFLACACPHPPTHQAEPHPHCRSCRPILRTSKKQDTPSGVSCFSMGSEGVMPWQNGSDRNISRYSGGTVRCNVPPDRNAAA